MAKRELVLAIATLAIAACGDTGDAHPSATAEQGFSPGMAAGTGNSPGGGAIEAVGTNPAPTATGPTVPAIGTGSGGIVGGGIAGAAGLGANGTEHVGAAAAAITADAGGSN